MSIDSVEAQIAEWRSYVAKAPAVNGRDLDELDAHLRDQIAELGEAGLTGDEAFLVAVKRMGDLDTLSREFAREHRGRLWKQLVLSGEDEPARPPSGWLEALVFAVAAAVALQAARLAARFPRRGGGVAAAQRQPARAAVRGRVLRPPAASSTPGDAFSRPRRSRCWRWWSTSTRTTRTRRPRPSWRSTCRWPCGLRSPTRTWAARSGRTSGAWTSSASPANGSSTTRSSRSAGACCWGSPR